jgi:hypothetical protein
LSAQCGDDRDRGISQPHDGRVHRLAYEHFNMHERRIGRAISSEDGPVAKAMSAREQRDHSWTFDLSQQQ